MIEKNKNGLVFWTDERFTNSGLVKHGFSGRLGGVSRGNNSELNFGFSKGDDPDAVRENYRRFGLALDIDHLKIAAPQQKHTDHIGVARAEDAGSGLWSPLHFPETDGLITNDPGVVLATYYADCYPILLLDPIKKAIGAVHSGWRGTTRDIGKRAVEKMTAAYGSDPADILATVGPGIGKCCFEIESDVLDAFRHRMDFVEKVSDTKWHVDLPGIIRLTLLEAGLREENLRFAGLCTRCRMDLFHSHRGSKGTAGSMMALISLT